MRIRAGTDKKKRHQYENFRNKQNKTKKTIIDVNSRFLFYFLWILEMEPFAIELHLTPRKNKIPL